MLNPVDQGDQPLSSYLLKLLGVLVKRAGGELRIPSTDILDFMEGEGILKSYDRDKHELVLRHAPPGSACYFIKPEESQWPTSRVSPKTPSSMSAPLPQTSSPVVPSASLLDDERLADMEATRQREMLARSLAHFPEDPRAMGVRPRMPVQPSPVEAAPSPSRRIVENFYKP